MSFREDLVWPLHSLSVIGDNNIYFHTISSAAESKTQWLSHLNVTLKLSSLTIWTGTLTKKSQLLSCWDEIDFVKAQCWDSKGWGLKCSPKWINRFFCAVVLRKSKSCQSDGKRAVALPYLTNHLHRNFGSPTSLSRLSWWRRRRRQLVLENHNSYCISRMFLRFCHLTKPGR